MAAFSDREHYIPLRKSDLIAALCKDSKLGPSDRLQFQQFCQLISAIWHFEYHATLERIKDAYAPFDPDSVTVPMQKLPPDQRQESLNKVFDQFIGLMEKANFKRLSRADIEKAIDGGASDWGINMFVDWSVFERLEVFIRGEGHSQRIKFHPIFFWRSETKRVDTYQRVVILLKMCKHRSLPSAIDTEDIFVKMFKDIPCVDLEMVLPGTRLQMPLFQKYKMGGSLVGTLGYAIWKVGYDLWLGILGLLKVTVTTAATVVGTVMAGLWGPILLLAGYGYKQYYSFVVTKQTYAKMLTESLYYQNLDNNLGVVTQLIDEAEEQECRECILAYFYLWKYAPLEGWTSEQIDDYIELELEGKWNLKVDFEVSDALAKLEELKLVKRTGDKYHAVQVEKALELLDHRWDNYYTFNQA